MSEQPTPERFKQYTDANAAIDLARKQHQHLFHSISLALRASSGGLEDQEAIGHLYALKAEAKANEQRANEAHLATFTDAGELKALFDMRWDCRG